MTTSWQQRVWRFLLTYGFWILMTFLTLVPIWWMFVVSMRSRVELFARPNFLISRFFFENYSNVLTDSAFQRYMTNSLVISTSNAILVMVLALLATYALSRYKLVGKDNIFFWLITNRMAPPAAFLLPLFLMFTRGFHLGDWTLFDTQIGLILLYCVFNLPFAIWLLKGVVDGIPIELDDAAMIDGAGVLGVIAPCDRALGGARFSRNRHIELDIRLERILVCGQSNKCGSANHYDGAGRVCYGDRHKLGRAGGDVDDYADSLGHHRDIRAALYCHGAYFRRGERIRRWLNRRKKRITRQGSSGEPRKKSAAFCPFTPMPSTVSSSAWLS